MIPQLINRDLAVKIHEPINYVIYYERKKNQKIYAYKRLCGKQL